MFELFAWGGAQHRKHNLTFLGGLIILDLGSLSPALCEDRAGEIELFIICPLLLLGVRGCDCLLLLGVTDRDFCGLLLKVLGVITPLLDVILCGVHDLNDLFTVCNVMINNEVCNEYYV